jgi:hypothetical protein
VRYGISLVAAASLIALAGCQRSDDPTAPELKLPAGPRFDVQNMDCQLNAQQCAAIQAGIDAMKLHANPVCRMYGGFAQDRYDAASGEGFRNDSQQFRSDGTPLDMGVAYTTSSSGVTTYSPYTSAYPDFWAGTASTDAVGTGALIAHEEAHHLGYGESYAQSVQNECLNPSS